MNSHSRLSRFHLATVPLFLVALVGIAELWGRGTPAALAQVVETSNKNASVSFTQRSQIQRDSGSLLSSDTARYYFQGTCTRLESLNDDGTLYGAMIIDTNSQQIMKLDYSSKTAHQWKLDEKELADLPGDASHVIDKLRSQTSNAELLGEEKVMGQSAKVYKLNVAESEIKKLPEGYTSKILVDSQTGLPVKTEIDCIDHGRKIQYVDEDYKWNEPLDPKLFCFDTPPGFSVIQGQPEGIR